MGYKTQIIKHSDISDSLLNEICRLKAVRWNYSIDEHKKWIEKNIQSDDIHLLIFDESELVAYMNFVFIEATLNKDKAQFIGIGNVCTNRSGQGLGNKLMNEANQFIGDNDYRGLLVCKEKLVDFYKRFNWNTVHEQHDVFYMVYNVHEEISNFQYDDRPF